MVSRPLLLILFLSIGSSTPSPAADNNTGILLSGGHHTNVEGTSVELYVPSTGLSCSLPSLPDDRWGHTMDSLLICGGYDSSSTASSCLSFSSGQWVFSHTLLEGRADHTSWQTEQGLLLMGGYIPYTSEIVHMEEEQGEPSFAMQYDTKESCSIPDMSGDSVIMTGGYYTKDKVSRYGRLGFVEDLPSLGEGRYGHGCGAYIRGDGTRVCWIYIKLMLRGSCRSFYMTEDGIQVFLVAGGWDGNINLSSTELMSSDSLTWTMASRLPRAVYAVRGLTVSNTLYMIGGEDGTFRNEILAWQDEEQRWEEIGRMKIARYYHAVTSIQLDDQVMEYCG